MCCASLLETVTEKSVTAAFLVPTAEAKNEKKDNEIRLFGMLQQRQIRWHERGRDTFWEDCFKIEMTSTSESSQFWSSHDCVVVTAIFCIPLLFLTLV
jgi:hypothetical protein